MERPAQMALLLSLIGATLVIGCESAPKQAQAGTTDPAPATAMTAGIDTMPTDGRPPAPWDDPASPIHRRVIYFSYDRTDILPEYAPLLRAHAGFLASEPDTEVIVEGHTDERGTREYNLALGDQRARAVRQFLIAEGVRASQVDVVSYGEETPARIGHDESAWAMNRRARLDYDRGDE